MSPENWIFIGLTATSNIIVLIKSYTSFSTRLTRIEDDVKWIIKNCELCPPTLDKNFK